MKVLLAFSLLLTGYLVGSIERPLQAQSTLYGGDNHGNTWSSHQSLPNGPTYYYGSDGTSGMYTPPAASYLPNTKPPC